MRARLAMIAAVGGLALAVTPTALADPVLRAPDPGAAFTARVGQLTFRARVDALTPPALPSQIRFLFSRSDNTNASGILSDPINTATLFADPLQGNILVYQAGPDSDTNWPKVPDTYHWQARYDDCVLADPNCFSTPQSLTIEPLPPPAHRLPADNATFPYGGDATLSVQDVPTYAREGTRIEIEVSNSPDLSPDGTFADPERVVRPTFVGGGLYRYRFPEAFTRTPGTYYWIVERFDCLAEADCYVTDGQVRSFTVDEPVGTPVPQTTITRHPAHRTRKRRARFAFESNLPDASFQCHYTGGWSSCQSPERFRNLSPGRYRFKVRAVRSGKRDTTPATWLFRVVRRR